MTQRGCAALEGPPGREAPFGRGRARLACLLNPWTRVGFMHTFQDDFSRDCALSAYEAVAVAIPGPWASAKVDLKRHERGLLLFAGATTTVSGAFDRPHGVQVLRDTADLGGSSMAASFAFSRLDELCVEAGVRWDGSGARLEPRGGGLEVALLNGDAEVAVLDIPPEQYGERLFTDPLGRLFEAELPAATAAQGELAAELEGLKRWSWNGTTGLLSLDKPSGKVDLPAMAVGSHSQESSFLWGWANSSFQPEVKEAVGRLRDATRGEGLGAFRRAGFYCAEDFSMRLALVAAQRCGARAVFPARTGTTKVFFGLVEAKSQRGRA